MSLRTGQSARQKSTQIICFSNCFAILSRFALFPQVLYMAAPWCYSSSHSQHSCTSQEATAGCSPHPHLAAPLTGTQSCKKRTTPHIRLPSCQHLPKKRDQRRVPKEPSARGVFRGKRLRCSATSTLGITKKTINPQFDTDHKHVSYIWAAHRKRWAQSRTHSQLRKWPELWQNNFQGSGELV